MEGNTGAARLAAMLTDRINQQANKPPQIQLAEVQADLSLKIDRFAYPIQVGDYLVLDQLTKSYVEGTAAAVNGNHAGTTWGYPNPGGVIGPGDRVLVQWLNEDTEVVVIGKVVADFA